MAGLTDMPSLQEIMAQQRRQQAFSGLTAAGLALMGGAPPIQGLMAGLGQIQPDPMNALQTYAAYNQIEDAERRRAEEERQQTARSTLLGGYDPSTGIDWKQGRQWTGATSPAEAGGLARPDIAQQAGLFGQARVPGLASQAFPAAVDAQAIKSMFPDPLKGQSPLGRLEVDRRAGLLDEPTYSAAKEAALRSPDDLTALQKDVPYISKTLNISAEQAMRMKMMSAGKTRDAFEKDAALRYISSQFASPEEAAEAASGLADILYGTAKPKIPTKKEKGLLAKITEAFGFGGEEAVASDRMEQILSMDREGLAALVRSEGASLTESERELIDRRWDALGE